MFLQFSPIRTKKKPKAIIKENESNKMEVLSLAPFTANPKLFFDSVKVGDTSTIKLLIKNPTSYDIQLFVRQTLPSELNVSFNWEQQMVYKGSEIVFEITWSPMCEECCRHLIIFEDFKKIQREVPIAFKSIGLKKRKTIVKQKTPVPKIKSPLRKSPSKKYYTSRPSHISPKKYSSDKYTVSPKSSLNRYSIPKHYGVSPKKFTKPINDYSVLSNGYTPVLRKKSLSPKFTITTPTNNTYTLSKCQYFVESPKNHKPDDKENLSVSNIFKPAKNASFHLDSMETIERRETYVLKNRVDENTIFDDSLEKDSIIPSPILELSARKPRAPLSLCHRDNLSPNLPVATYLDNNLHKGNTLKMGSLEYKLMNLDSFRFTPDCTPVKDNFTPPLSSTVQKQQKNGQDKTYDLPESETINVSSETYVKGNTSFETYVVGNLSGGTYTKDTSVGDLTSLNTSPGQTKAIISPTFKNHNFSSTLNQKELSCIMEESFDVSHRILKRKSDIDFSVLPSKRASTGGGINSWSKYCSNTIRVAKATTGLNLHCSTIPENTEVNATLTKKDTNIVVIRNPFLLAATNSLDPFMTPQLNLDEEWIDKQIKDFTKWLNALLTPPDEFNEKEHIIDVTKIWQECKKHEVEAAPTKEIICNNYHNSNKLNSLRKSAQNLYYTKEMTTVITKVIAAVEEGKINIRKDKDVHLNLAIKSEIMESLLSYNTLWLRIALETIYNEVIPLKSNSDLLGLSTFIVNRFLKDPSLIKKHKTMHSPRYKSDFNKFFLKKYLILVYFLDQAKQKKLISHDPCLFRRGATVKESREMLLRLNREILASIGDVTKLLKFFGYIVTHVQTYIHEYDYAVKNLGVDLRDGVRLTRVMEIIMMRNDLTNQLRVPAISRLQKVHNMKIVFDSLKQAGYVILYDISHKDIVDGHKEKTLSFLWQIIFKFEAPLMVKSATTIQNWYRSLPISLKRRKIKREWFRREKAAQLIQKWYVKQKLSRNILSFSSVLKKYLTHVRRERAAIRIQSYYRMYHCKSLYVKKLNIVMSLQRHCKGWLIRNVLRKQIKGAVIIQSYVRMYLVRKRFLKLKAAVTVIQNRHRAMNEMKTICSRYSKLRSTVIHIQRKFRAKVLRRNAERNYKELRFMVVKMQQIFRANRLYKIEHKQYVKLKSATLKIQTWYRSLKSMKTHREQFLKLKHSIFVIEQRYLALKVMRSDQKKYKALKSAAKTIQERYRARRAMKIHRALYLQLKYSCIVVQRQYKAKKAMEQNRAKFIKLRNTTIFVQHLFRANKYMKIERLRYVVHRNAAIKIQTWFRSCVEMQRCRTYYLSLKYAVKIIEDRYIAKRLMIQEKIKYNHTKNTILYIQRKYRANILMKQANKTYQKLRAATLYIQRHFKANRLMKEQRRNYLELKKKTVDIQRRWRAKVVGKYQKYCYQSLRRASIIIQRRWRANQLAKHDRNWYLTLRKATVTVQILWRAKVSGQQVRSDYIALKAACLFVQQKWRANKQKQNYQSLRKATVVLQQRWRARKACIDQKTAYLNLRASVIKVQSRWRALLLMRQQNKYYNSLRNSILFVQRQWVAKRLRRHAVRNYTSLRAATILIQSIFKANRQRRCFIQLRNASIIVQRRWRANKAMKIQRDKYELYKKFTVIIQQRWRAKKLYRVERQNYQELKYAVILIQQKWRANIVAQKQKHYYQALRKAAVVLQQRWRAKKACMEQRDAYIKLRASVMMIQSRWRALIVMRKYKIYYSSLKNAVIFIQRRWIAKMLCREAVENYTSLRAASILIQSRFKAKTQRRCFKRLKDASVVIERRWRAYRAMIEQKARYQLLRRTTIVTQQRWRAKKRCIEQRLTYLELRNATLNVQTRWRANVLARKQKQGYEELRRAVIVIQQRWRARKACINQRKKYVELKSSVSVVQAKWRAIVLMRQQRLYYNKLRKYVIYIQRRWTAKLLCRKAFVYYSRLRTAAIFIQTKYRAIVECRRNRQYFQDLKTATIIIQIRWRAIIKGRICRSRYLTLLRTIVIVQQRWRARKLMQIESNRYMVLKNSTIILQSYIRGYLVRLKYADYFTPEARERRRVEKIENEAAVKIQAAWRGHRSRSLDSTIHVEIRKRVKIANENAVPENTLGNRQKVALQILASEHCTLSYIVKALDDVDFITRRCPHTCHTLSKFLPTQLYIMLSATSRSLPEMTACISTVNILINFYKHTSSRPNSFLPEYIDTLLTVMMHWCDKESPLFSTICTLLWMFAHNPEWKNEISGPETEQKLLKVQNLVARKKSMVHKTRAKGMSVFANYDKLPIPTLKADWGLDSSNRLYKFQNSVHALMSLLKILEA